MPACSWPQEYEIGFVKNHLGSAFKRTDSRHKIWVLDHNYNLWGRAISELDDPDLRKYLRLSCVPRVCRHRGHDEQSARRSSGLQLVLDRGRPRLHRSDYATDWANWGKTFTEVIRNWCRAMTGWNLALDEKGRPNIGPFYVRRDGDHPFRDQRNHAQRTVLGLWTFLAQRPAWCAADRIQV